MHLPLTPYDEALELQQRLHAARVADEAPDTLLLLEHPPTITRGRSAMDGHLLADEEALARRGIALRDVGRGGDYTVHGPGQLVGYPILKLDRGALDLHGLLRDIEAALIDALACFGVEATRIDGLTGVFATGAKVAAIGLQVKRFVTLHGFALNVTTDLSLFGHIVPCGLHDRPMTSLERVLQPCPTMDEVAEAVARCFCARLRRTMV